MSKTESGRVFFIDHINKVTTWVCEMKFIHCHFKANVILFFLDWSTNGQNIDSTICYWKYRWKWYVASMKKRSAWCNESFWEIVLHNRKIGNLDGYRMGASIISIIVRWFLSEILIDSWNYDLFQLLENKTTTWVDPRIAGPVKTLTIRKTIFFYCMRIF